MKLERRNRLEMAYFRIDVDFCGQVRAAGSWNGQKENSLAHANSSSSALASFKSLVLKPSVNQP
jgi:hypothetical protein